MTPIFEYRICGLPIKIDFYPNGCISISPVAVFRPIFDEPEEGVSAVITFENLLVGKTEIEYNTLLEYKHIPELLSWLIQQKLVWPFSSRN